MRGPRYLTATLQYASSMLSPTLIHTQKNYRIKGGEGQETKWKTPSPNFEELIESITNMLFFFFGGGGGGGEVSRYKSYKVSKLGGGGGGWCLGIKVIRYQNWGGGGGGGSLPKNHQSIF